MKFIRSFSAQTSESPARQRIGAFFTRAGYRRLPDTGGSMHFKRGSINGTLLSFDPTKWKCIVDISIQSDRISSVINVKVEISSDPTEKHFVEELLTAELNLLEIAVTTNELKTYDADNLKKRVSAHVSLFVGKFSFFLVSVVLGILAGLLAAIYLNISTPGTLAISFSVVLVLFGSSRIFWKRPKK